MTSDKSRRVEVKKEGQTIAAADVTPLENPEGTVRTSVRPSSGPSAAGIRTDLVDAVMDLPEVQHSSRLEATVPVGDSESLSRLRERTKDAVTRPAGSTVLLDGDIAPAPDEGRRQEPEGGASAS